MRKNILLNNFSGGEWSPFLDGRSDLQKYETGCIRMENFRPLPWGGASFRAGLEFFGLAKFANHPVRLIPFNYSTALGFIIEAGEFYMRFWNSDGSRVVVTAAAAIAASTPYPIGAFTKDTGNNKIYYCIAAFTTGGSPTQPSADATHWVQQNTMEIPTPYTADQMVRAHFKQINAQMRLVHPSIPPQTLTFGGGFSWTIAETAFKYPVLLDQNANQTITMSVADNTEGASTTLTATAPAWATTTYYPQGNSVKVTGVIYNSTLPHTSGATFAADLAAGKWSVASIFNASHVGSYWELQHLRQSASVILDMNNQSIGVQVFSSPIEIEGAWTFTTSQFWWGEVQVQRSVDNGATWTVIRDFTAKSDQNYSTSGTENPPNIGAPPVLYRIAFTMAGSPFDPAVWNGSTPSQYAYAQASLESQDAYVAGIVKVTAFTDAEHVTVTNILAPNSTEDTYLWSEGAFSNYRGFPGTIAFYEQRLLYSGTAYQANTIWGSVTGDFDNFKYSSDDDGALAFQPAVCQQNQTAWLAPLLNIHLCTSGEEILMGSGNLDEALTPANVTLRAQSYYGSATIMPLLMQNSLLFVERNGVRVREMRELSPYIVPTDFQAPDLTLMAEHITHPGIVAMDFGRLPDPLAYFIRSDGVMPVMTYNREQNIMAWSRYVTDGEFESVACIFGSPADEVFVSVLRQLNGSFVRCIEGFTTDPGQNPNIVTNLLLDCGAHMVAGIPNPVTGTQFNTGADHVTGLTWLEGETVTAVIDGAEYAGLTVDGSGRLDFPPNVKATVVVNVGLPYTGYLSPMKPVIMDQDGTSQGHKVRATEVVLRVRNSISVEYAGVENPTSTDWREQQFRLPGDTVGSNTPLTNIQPDNSANPNGIADWPLSGPWPDGNNFAGQLNFRQAHPFPLTIIAAFTKFDLLD